MHDLLSCDPVPTTVPTPQSVLYLSRRNEPSAPRRRVVLDAVIRRARAFLLGHDFADAPGGVAPSRFRVRRTAGSERLEIETRAGTPDALPVHVAEQDGQAVHLEYVLPYGGAVCRGAVTDVGGRVVLDVVRLSDYLLGTETAAAAA